MAAPTKEEQFALVKDQILDNIDTWADLFEHFDMLMARVTETMHPTNVLETLFSMYAFMHALRELPEEGDIKVLVERMLRIMVFEGEEKLGSEMTVMQVKDLQEYVQERMLQAMSSVGLQQGDGAKRKH